MVAVALQLRVRPDWPINCDIDAAFVCSDPAAVAYLRLGDSPRPAVLDSYAGRRDSVVLYSQKSEWE